MANASDRDPRMHRRAFVLGAGAFGMALGTAGGTAYTQIASSADHSLRIAPLRLELAPDRIIDTYAYNSTVPGPVLRLREDRQVSIDENVVNYLATRIERSFAAARHAVELLDSEGLRLGRPITRALAAELLRDST